MNFQIVNGKINDILNASAVADNYQVIGYPQNVKTAEAVNKKRQVVSFYSSGRFPTNTGGMNSTTHQHKATFNITLRVAVKASDEDAGFLTSGNRANIEMDDLIDKVWNVIMAGENLFLKTDTNGRNGIVSGRVIENIEKSAFEEQGEFAVMMATMSLTAQMSESVTGVTGEVIEEVDSDLKFEGDDTTLQGTKSNLPLS